MKEVTEAALRTLLENELRAFDEVSCDLGTLESFLPSDMSVPSSYVRPFLDSISREAPAAMGPHLSLVDFRRRLGSFGVERWWPDSPVDCALRGFAFAASPTARAVCVGCGVFAEAGVSLPRRHGGGCLWAHLETPGAFALRPPPPPLYVDAVQRREARRIADALRAAAARPCRLRPEDAADLARRGWLLEPSMLSVFCEGCLQHRLIVGATEPLPVRDARLHLPYCYFADPCAGESGAVDDLRDGDNDDNGDPKKEASKMLEVFKKI